MQTKQLLPIILAILLLLAFAGCAKEQELDPYIKTEPTENIGDVETTSNQDILEAGTNPAETTEPVDEWPDPQEILDAKKALFNVSSEWTSDGVLTEGIYRETADLTDGGQVEVMLYYGFFQQVTLTVLKNTQENNAASVVSFFRSYLNRELSEYEVFVVTNALQEALGTDDIYSIQDIEGAGAYAFANENSIQFVVS